MTQKEITQAKRRIRTAFATRRDGAYALLSALNEDLASGDWTRFVTLPKDLEKVTATQIQEVAQKYLLPTTSTVGWFVAKKS